MELEKAKEKSRYSKLLYESETEKVKLKSEIESYNVKLSCQEKSLNIFHTELNMMEKRFKQKCDDIVEQDSLIRNLKCQIKKLDEEMLSIKLSLSADNATQPWETVAVNNNKSTTTQTNEKVTKATETLEQNPHTNTDKRNNQDRRKSNHSQDSINRDKPTIIGKRYSDQSKSNTHNKHMLMVGTSNIKYLSAKYMADFGRNNLYVKKHIRYSLKDTKDFIKGYEGIQPDMLAYLVTCNDLEKNKCDDIVRDMEDLIDTTNTMFGNKPIVISLPLPRKERDINLKAQQVSAAFRNKLSRFQNVTFSDNCNLTYRGLPLDGILCDKKHLSRWGTETLARNLRDDFAELVIKGQ
jgi:hypothetical protein